MNVLVLGSGGREHALAWKIAKSNKLSDLFIAPGNAGTQLVGTNIAADLSDFEAIKKIITNHSIGLVIVGPEVPLVDGLVDVLELSFPDLPIVGPKASGAQLEGSKAFSKDFMARHGIPTAAYREFTQDELLSGLEYLRPLPLPIVLKADGLAAGKGVLICQSHEEANREFREMLGGKFGNPMWLTTDVIFPKDGNGYSFYVSDYPKSRSVDGEGLINLSKLYMLKCKEIVWSEK